MCSVRIVGGKWRRRKIFFSENRALRPTQDRIRETIFNWLHPYIINARCLDAFAGTGVFGFEALSRGARSVLFLDHDAHTIQVLHQTQKLLHAEEVCIQYGTIPQVIPMENKFDLVFLDPPYRKNLIHPALLWLKHNQLIHENSLIVLEKERAEWIVPASFVVLKHQCTQHIEYYLLGNLKK